jgi:signal transduction histidine kinase
VPAEKLKIASTFMNIGIGFHTLEQYDKALEYYNKALEGAMAEKSERSEYNIKLQIANLHNDTENFNEALLLYQEIIDSKVFEKSAFALAKVYNNFASAFQGVKKFTEAENYFLKAYKINQQLGIENSACRNLNNLGNLNLEINKPTKAIEFSLQALELAKKTNDLYMQQSVYAVLSDAFEMNKNFRKSVEYHNLEDVVKDSINALEMRQTIADLESKYQLEQKQQTIKNLETENQLRESEIKRKNTVNLFTTAVLLIIVVALVFVILAFRKVRKQKVLLDKQKQELELLNDSLNKMFAIISHDLRNLIAGIKSSSELVNLFIEKDEKEKLTDQAQKLIGNTNRLETLLNNLLNWAISQGGLYKPQTEFLFIKKPIDDLIELSKPAAYDKNIELISHLNTDDQVLVDPDNFSFIFRNLLSNAIKFTQNGTVTFHAVADKKFTSIHVSDTGVGIPPEKLKNIFSLKKANKSLGTSGEKGTGLGLKLVHDFVKLNGGIIKIDSTPNKGTTVIVELPNC